MRCLPFPILMVLLLVTNDFLTMSLTTDRARPSPRPDVWRIGPITTAAIALGLVKLAFSTAVLAIGRFGLGLTIGPLRTLAFFTMVVDAQATVYAIRERRRPWSRVQGGWVVASSAADLGVGALVALSGWLNPVALGRRSSSAHCRSGRVRAALGRGEGAGVPPIGDRLISARFRRRRHAIGNTHLGGRQPSAVLAAVSSGDGRRCRSNSVLKEWPKSRVRVRGVRDFGTL